MTTPSICQVVMGPDALIFVFINGEFSACFFTLLIHPHEKALYFLFTFYLFPCYHLYIWGFWCFIHQSWCQLVIHSAGILIVYSAYDSHKQVTITSVIMLLSVLNWSTGPRPIQFLHLDSFKGGFNFYFLKSFIVPTPFRFDLLHLDTIFSSWGIYHCLIRFFPGFLFFFFPHHTLFHLFPPFSVQFSSVVQSSLTLYNPMNHSTPGLSVHSQPP